MIPKVNLSFLTNFISAPGMPGGFVWAEFAGCRTFSLKTRKIKRSSGGDVTRVMGTGLEGTVENYPENVGCGKLETAGITVENSNFSTFSTVLSTGLIHMWKSVESC